MSGEVENGQCEICKKEATLTRTVYRYQVQCECHAPQHFEMVRHCADCEPVEPETTQVIHKTSELREKWSHLRMAPNSLSHPPMEIFIHNQETGKVTTIGGGEPPEEDIWEQAQRFMDSIRDEIKSENPDQESIRFWLFKIERGVNIFRAHLQGK